VRQIANGAGSLRRVADRQAEAVVIFKTCVAVAGVIFAVGLTGPAVAFDTGVRIAGIEWIVVFYAVAVFIFDVTLIATADVIITVICAYAAVRLNAWVGIAGIDFDLTVSITICAFRQTDAVFQCVMIGAIFAVFASITGVAQAIWQAAFIDHAHALIAGKTYALFRQIFAGDTNQAVLYIAFSATVALRATVCRLAGADRLIVIKRARAVLAIVLTGLGYAVTVVIEDIAVITDAVRITFHLNAACVVGTFKIFTTVGIFFFIIAAAGRQ